MKKPTLQQFGLSDSDLEIATKREERIERLYMSLFLGVFIIFYAWRLLQVDKVIDLIPTIFVSLPLIGISAAVITSIFSRLFFPQDPAYKEYKKELDKYVQNQSDGKHREDLLRGVLPKPSREITSAAKIIEKYGEAIGNDSSVLRDRKTLPCSKAKIRESFYLCISYIIEQQGGLPKEFGQQLVTIYSMLDSFTTKEEIDQYNSVQEMIKNGRLNQQNPQDKKLLDDHLARSFKAFRNSCYFDEINDYIEECYKKNKTKAETQPTALDRGNRS